VRFLAFAVRSGRTAKALFPVVQGPRVGEQLNVTVKGLWFKILQ
jgi:hypothetical protein